MTNRFDLSLLSQRKATIPSPFTRKHITKERKGGRAIVRFAHFLSPVIFRILLERKEFEAGVGRFPPFFANVPPNASLKKKELVFLSISFIDTRTYPARGKGQRLFNYGSIERVDRGWIADGILIRVPLIRSTSISRRCIISRMILSRKERRSMIVGSCHNSISSSWKRSDDCGNYHYPMNPTWAARWSVTVSLDE